jgi:YidC/Oxa1 family membrane protein insertase
MKLSQPKDQLKNESKKTDKNDLSSAMPDPQMMQKMMLWMIPPMIGVSAYFFPAGIGIYWLVGTLFMIAQQCIVNALHDQKKVS